MENENMSGRWAVEFTTADGGARLPFTEEVTGKHWWMTPLSPGILNAGRDSTWLIRGGRFRK